MSVSGVKMTGRELDEVRAREKKCVCVCVCVCAV